MSCRAGSNIKIEPVKIWFANQYQACIHLLQDASATYNNKYFTIDGDGENFYVWYNYNAGGTDPAVASRTEIEVAVGVGDTKAEIVAATIAAINAEAGLKAIADERQTDRLILKVLSYAVAGASAIGTMTSALWSQDVLSSGFFQDLGFTDGDLELTMDQQLVDVTAMQKGSTIIAAIVNGINVELAVALKEVTEENLERLIDLTTGSTATSGGSTVRGYGTGQNSRNVLDYAARLILHPVRLADNVYTSDVCMPLAYPKVDSLMFSGENPQMLNLTFRVFGDEFLPAGVDTAMFGDHTKF
jgi:hypothetical protein